MRVTKKKKNLLAKKKVSPREREAKIEAKKKVEEK